MLPARVTRSIPRAGVDIRPSVGRPHPDLPGHGRRHGHPMLTASATDQQKAARRRPHPDPLRQYPTPPTTPTSSRLSPRPVGAAKVLRATAENLQLADGRFDVAMALVTLHHWRDWATGLREMQRVANRVVVLHFDPASLHTGFWLVRDYLPEIAELGLTTPSVEQVAAALGEDVEVRTLPVPWDCTDGFLPAFWRRPQAYQNPVVQQSMSGLQLLDPKVLTRGMTQLRVDLEDGTWQRKNSNLLELDALDVGWRLISTRTTLAGDLNES